MSNRFVEDPSGYPTINTDRPQRAYLGGFRYTGVNTWVNSNCSSRVLQNADSRSTAVVRESSSRVLQNADRLPTAVNRSTTVKPQGSNRYRLNNDHRPAVANIRPNSHHDRPYSDRREPAVINHQGPTRPQPQVDARKAAAQRFQDEVALLLQHFHVIARVATAGVSGTTTAHEKALLTSLVKFLPKALRNDNNAKTKVDELFEDIVISLRFTGVNLRVRAIEHSYANAVAARNFVAPADINDYTARAFNNASHANSVMQGIRRARNLVWTAQPRGFLDAIHAALEAMTDPDLSEQEHHCRVGRLTAQTFRTTGRPSFTL